MGAVISALYPLPLQTTHKRAERPFYINRKEEPMDCTHHWIIETPNGPHSEGKCKHCGKVSGMFANSERDYSRREISDKWARLKGVTGRKKVGSR